MQGKGNFIILLVIVAVLTLTLAVLAGYLFFVAGSPEKSATASPDVTIVTPDINDLSYKSLFDSKQYFNLKNDDSNKIAVIEINAEIVYFTKVNGVKDVDALLTAYMGEIRQMFTTYFMNMTVDEAKQPETIKKAQEELTKNINELINRGEKEKKSIVWTINFDRWFYQG